MEAENLKRTSVTKSRSRTQKNINSSTQKVKPTEEYKKHLQFKEDSEVISVIEKDIPNEDCANDECKTLKEEKPLENEHEKLVSDIEICSSTQESSLPQKRHQCDLCNKSFKSLHRLKAHKRQHDCLSPYTCNYEGCERSFNRRHSFNKHLKDHKPVQPKSFKCNLDNCERTYKNISALNIHKRKFHQCGPELKTHMCEVCGKVFKSSAVLNDHHYTHIDKTQLPYACEEEGCTKRFSNKDKLKVHKMRHAGIKNFICPYCGMRKTTHNELKTHINYHTLERTWPCRFCPKVCNSAGNLKMHVKNMHERAKDFACRFCERTFAKADTRKYHEMTHTGEKPNECNECGRRFLQPGALRTHRKIHLKQKTNLEEKEKCEVGIEMKVVQNGVEGNETTLITDAIVVDILNENNANLH